MSALRNIKLLIGLRRSFLNSSFVFKYFSKINSCCGAQKRERKFSFALEKSRREIRDKYFNKNYDTEL